MTPAPIAALSLIAYRYEIGANEYVYVIAEDAPYKTSVEGSPVRSLHLQPQEGYPDTVEVYRCERCWMPAKALGRMNLTGWVPLYLGPQV